MKWKSCWLKKGPFGLNATELLEQKDGPDLAAEVNNKIKLIKSPATKVY